METQEYKEQIQSGLLGLFNEVTKPVKNQVVRWNSKKLRTGLRHGRGRFTGRLDRFFAGHLEYGLGEISSGMTSKPIRVQNVQIGTEMVPIKKPSDAYTIGRYMSLAERLVEFGLSHCDVGTTMTGVRVYEWLGQSQRQYVRNKVERVYRKVVELAAEHDIPLSSPGDRSFGAMYSGERANIERYLGKGV